MVSDNDGSAFITKAEFDSLKNNFQAQIDNYNSAIDSKIDGAIASYLSGINLATVRTVVAACYTSTGIMSVRGRDDLKWKEGQIYIKSQYSQRRWNKNEHTSTTAGAGEYTVDIVVGETGKPFTELGVTNLNASRTEGQWLGEVENSYRDSTYGQLVYFDVYNFSVPTTNIYLSVGNGEPSITNKKQTDWSNRHLWGLYSNDTGTGGTAFNAQAGYSNLTRTKGSYRNTDIIITKSSIAENRFTDQDDIMDYCNDSTTSDHTKIVLADYFKSCEGVLYVEHATATKIQSEKQTYSLNGTADKAYQWSARAIPDTAVWPYVGFVNISNWNKLWVTKYDSIVTHAGITSEVFTYDGIKHLGIVAGAPLAEANKDEIVTVRFEFQDKTKDYDVWLKPSAFTSSYDPIDDPDCIDTVIGGTVGTASRSYKITNGSGTLKFKMPQDGYIFTKWSFASNGGAGGGIFLPPTNITIESAT